MLHFLNPTGRGGHIVEVEHLGIDNFVELYIAVVGIDNLCLGLQGSYDFSNVVELVGLDLAGLVEQDDVTELNLLDN